MANKEQLLDGMVDVVVGEIDPPVPGTDWKAGIRQRILSARKVLLQHPWASRVIESRPQPTPVVLDYLNSIVGMFRAGGFSVDLTHHVMHVLGSRVWGFTQELFPASPLPADPDMQKAMFDEMAGRYPHIAEIAMAASHDEASVVGHGCDDQFEFEFAVDLCSTGSKGSTSRGGRPTTGPDTTTASGRRIRRAGFRTCRCACTPTKIRSSQAREHGRR